MTSRERLIAVLNHQRPDRVPIDLGGTPDTGVTGVAYNHLKSHLGLDEGGTRLIDLSMQVAKVGDRVRERFRGDVALVMFEAKSYRPWTLPNGESLEVPSLWAPVRESDGADVLMGPWGKPLTKRLPASFTFSPVGPLCPGLQSEKDIQTFMPVIRIMDRPPYVDETLEDLGQRARWLHEETSLGIFAYYGGHIFAAAQLLRGMDQFLCDLVERPSFARALMEAIADAHIKEFDHFFQAVGPWAQVVGVADDLGMQTGPQISPKMFREIVRPPMERFYRHMRSRMSCKLFLHSCGSVFQLIPDLIEMGVQVLNPVQVSATDMDTRSLKREFGKDLVFWGGGCDTQRVLPRGSREEIRREVRSRIEDLGRHGGMVFAQVHNIQPEVQPESIVTMLDAAYEFAGD